MGLCSSKDQLKEDVEVNPLRTARAAAGTGAAVNAPSGGVESFPVHVNERFSDLYTVGAQLGKGSYATVHVCVNKRNGQRYAAKMVLKAPLTKEDEIGLREEVSILKEARHPNIMVLFDFFDEPTQYILVVEKLDGGELFDRIVAKESYNEKEARDVIRLLLQALNYLHQRNMVHRDLKPENLLLQSADNDALIKLADFGFARRVAIESPNSLTTACGTPGYVAPEILEGRPYGVNVDIWSAGVISYILLCGYPPFHHENQAVLFRKIKSGRFEFDSPYWDAVSEEAKSFIRRMLTVDPARRATAALLLQDPWMLSGDAVLAARHLGTAKLELRKFNIRRRFRVGMKAIVAANRMKRLTAMVEAVRRT